jgi:Trypsin-co-occurring domain 1
VSKYLEFPLEGGGSTLIEAADEPTRTSAGFLRDGDSHAGADKAQQSFDASVEAVRRSADLLVSKLRQLTPDELQVNFNLKASGEVGGLTVGKSGADANYTVMLKWQKTPVKDEDKEKEKEKDKAKA